MEPGLLLLTTQKVLTGGVATPTRSEVLLRLAHVRLFRNTFPFTSGYNPLSRGLYIFTGREAEAQKDATYPRPLADGGGSRGGPGVCACRQGPQGCDCVPAT